MAPLNWNQLYSLDVDKLEEDEADEWFRELQTVKVEKETDVNRLQSLFKLCRGVLNIKALQAETAIEEGEKMMRSRTETGNEEAKLLQEIDELKDQISTLRRHAGGKDANSLLREEIRDLEEEKHRLTRELLDTKQELRHEEEKSEKYSQRLESFEKELRDLRKERDQLLEDVRDYQRQIQRHRESLTERKVEGEDFQKRIRNRNEDMLKLVNEVNNLAEANEILRNQVEELKSSLEECTHQMEKTTDQYARMKDALSEADAALESLQKENEELQRQLAEAGVRLPSQPSIHDELMEAVDKKIEEWKKIFHSKEKETESYKKQIEDLQQELVQYRVDSDKHSVVALTKALEERDQQIQILRDDLAKAAQEMESNSDLMEELRNQLSAGGSVSETQRRRMNLLQKAMKDNETRLNETMKKAQDAESAAIEKDKQMADIIFRMRQYETGEYGLAEAVDECRELKVQLDMRDKQTIELTQHCNKLELQINEILDENDEMRRRLGMDKRAPLDIKFKYAREVERETDRAMNIILQKEIERLEEERLDLKLQLRKLCHRIGERAVALGLSSDELMMVERFMEELKEKKTSQRSRSETRIEDPASPTIPDRRRMQQQPQKLFDDIARENRTLKTKLAHLETENTKLLQGLKEIRAQLNETANSAGNAGTAGIGIQMPTLDKLISYMETRELTGNVDAVLQLKSQLDYMTGRNDELRSELRHMTVDMQKARVELNSVNQKAVRLQDELAVWKDVHASGPTLQQIPFPENTPPSSALVMASLNEHLIHILHESDLKDQQLRKMEDAIDSYQRKLSVLKHQQGLLYRDFLDSKNGWEKEKQDIIKKLMDTEQMQIQAETTQVEFERLLDTLSLGDQDEMKRRLGEMTRKYTVMRINEKMLLRKYASITEMEQEARKEKEKAEKNTLEAEMAVIQKLRHLERQQDMTSYQLSSLYKALEESVPKSEHESLSRQHVELTEKYRAILEQESELVNKIKTQETVQLELNRLQRETEYLKTQLLTEKERSIKMELLEEASRISGTSWPAQADISDADSGVSVSELQSVSQRLAVLEMKELNERQRATHAQMMYEEERTLLRRVEDRNMEVERKFAEVTKMNLELQKIERELRDELSNCVTKSVNDADKKRIAQLEKSEAVLRGELDKMKELNEVSQAQYRYLENIGTVQNVELEELRKAVIDLQATGDSNAIIGKLHREIVHMKLGETMENTDLKLAKERIRTLEVQLLRIRTRFNAKEHELGHFRMEYVFRIQQMRRTIASLRERFAGSVPLKTQENMQKCIRQLQSDQERLQKELIEAVEKQQEANDRAEELKLRQRSLEELLATLKDGTGAKRVVEWHQKLEELRLSELKLKRQIVRAQEQTQIQSNLISDLESAISKLEDENVKITKAWEEREITWENREGELESKLRRYEMQEREEEEDLLEVSADVFGLPDMTLPLPQQLEKALVALRKYITADKTTRQQVDKMKKETENLHSEKRKLEADLLRKQRALLDLRKFLPTGAAGIVDGAVGGGWPALVRSMGNVGDQQSLQKTAQELLQATVSTLKARIEQKDEALEKYRQLLQSAQAELNEARREHLTETGNLRDELRETMERMSMAARARLGEVASELEKDELEKQLIRIAELEETVMNQEHTIGSLLEKTNGQLGQSNSTLTAELKGKLEKLELENLALKALSKKQDDQSIIDVGKQAKPEIQEEDEHESSLDESIETVYADTDTVIKPQRALRDIHVQTIEDYPVQSSIQQPQPVPPPSMSTVSQETHLKMKVRLDHTLTKLKEKESENKAFKQALAELQNDMTVQTTIRHRPQSAAGLRDLEMKGLKLKIEELETKVSKQAKELRNEKNKSEEVETEIETLKLEINRKDGTISKLKADKLKLENEVDNLETRLAHLRESVKMKLQETENRELKKKLAALEGQLRTMQGLPAEKPLESHAETRPEGVLKWEESKRWQIRLEKLRNKLQTKTQEADEQAKMIRRLKERMARLEQEKVYWDSRADKSSVLKRPSSIGSTETTDYWEKDDSNKYSEAASKPSPYLEKLGEELAFMRTRNFDLEQRCVELETQLIERQGASGIRKPETSETLGDQDIQSTEDADNVVQMLRRLLERATSERDQLRWDYDSIQRRLDEEREEKETLHTKVEDIQRELQSANEEIEELREDLEQQPKGTNIETINRLHETIDKLENEKSDLARQLEELKLSSARLSDEEMQKIVKENKELKAKLSKTAPRVAWAQQLTGDSKDGKASTLIRENGKLRTELQKLQGEINKLKSEVETIRNENGKLDKEVQRLRGIRAPVADAPVAVVKLIEEKEQALQKGSSRLVELEELLKQEIEKNQRHMFENRRLKDKLRALEWEPARDTGTSNADYLRQIRTLKAEIVECQSELSEMKMEVEALNRQIKPAFDASGDLDFDILKERMKIYDRVLHENIELKLECNGLKTKLRQGDGLSVGVGPSRLVFAS